MVVGQYNAGRQALESGRKEEEPGLMNVCFSEVFEWSVINFSDSREMKRWARLHISAGILQIPVFFRSGGTFSTGIRIPVPP
jgi:hypothetical protein